ncbi:MAG: hypothetical protein ACK2TX_09550 [Anaerolineales bacterium]
MNMKSTSRPVFHDSEAGLDVQNGILIWYRRDGMEGGYQAVGFTPAPGFKHDRKGQEGFFVESGEAIFKGESPLPSSQRPALPRSPDDLAFLRCGERAFLQSVGAIFMIASTCEGSSDEPEVATASEICSHLVAWGSYKFTLRHPLAASQSPLHLKSLVGAPFLRR